MKQADSVIGAKSLDGRKVSALKTWGLIGQDGDRMKLTEQGRRYAKGDEVARAAVLQEIIRSIPPYYNIVERAALQGETSVTAADVGAQWHAHFPQDVAESDKTINDQAVCFFHIAQGASLGTVIVGRKGNPTRFNFRPEVVQAYVGAAPSEIDQVPEETAGEPSSPPSSDPAVISTPEPGLETPQLGQGIFVAHGKDKKPLQQLKSMLTEFKIPFKIAEEEPNLGRPIGDKVRQTMQACNCAILIFSGDQVFKDEEGNDVHRPSENVVHELGACSYLYGNRIVILKDERISFPTNFQDIGYIPFDDDGLKAKTMDIIKELVGLGILKLTPG